MTRRGWWTGAMVAGALAVVTSATVVGVSRAAGPGGPGQAAGMLAQSRFADTPMGELILGRLGRALVLRAELDLSAAQRRQLRQIVMAHRAELAEAFEPVAERRQALREAVLAEPTDEDAIRDAAEALGEAIGDAAVKVAEVADEARDVLTEEQLDLLRQFRAENDAAVDAFFDELTQN